MTEVSTTQLADLRRKVLRNEPVSPEEYRAVLDSIRRSRKAETAAKPGKQGKATNSLLDQVIS